MDTYQIQAGDTQYNTVGIKASYITSAKLASESLLIEQSMPQFRQGAPVAIFGTPIRRGVKSMSATKMLCNKQSQVSSGGSELGR